MMKLNPGDIIGGRYQVVGYVDEGGMQVVYKSIDMCLKREVALKSPKVNSAEKRFKRSAVVSAKINHPNVAKTLDYFEYDGNQFLIEEFLNGVNLQKFVFGNLDYLDPYLTAKIFHSLSKGLAASHHVEVVHRDLKPSNIMISSEGISAFQIKITDFGIAKMAQKELEEAAEGGESTISASATAVGALPYMSPEAIENPTEVTLATDIWSLGAIMFELLTGMKPFSNGLKAVGRIVAGQREPIPDFVLSNPQFNFLSKQIIAIIDKCLQKDPNNRPTADELVKLCSEMCYHVTTRQFGMIKRIMHNSFGFITSNNTDYFFHFDSVYGKRPSERDKVYFSHFDGGLAPRALPVLIAK